MRKIENENYQALLTLRIEYLRLGFNCTPIEDNFFWVDLDTTD